MTDGDAVLMENEGAETPLRLPIHQAIASIERDGYCHIPGVFDERRIRRALELTRRWYDRTKDRQTRDVPALARNDHFVWNLQNKDVFFIELLLSCDILESILKHFLNDPWFKQIPAEDPNYIIRNYMARSSHARLPMHIDSLVPYTGDHVFVMQASIILEDQDRVNGCTVVVPGSHRSGAFVDQSAFEKAVPLVSRAGDLIVWDSRIWHGATENRSGGTRWALIGTFVRWWIKQGFNITGNLPERIYAGLSDKQRAVLGFCSIPHEDETRGIDMKRGYASLERP